MVRCGYLSVRMPAALLQLAALHSAAAVRCRLRHLLLQSLVSLRDAMEAFAESAQCNATPRSALLRSIRQPAHWQHLLPHGCPCSASVYLRVHVIQTECRCPRQVGRVEQAWLDEQGGRTARICRRIDQERSQLGRQGQDQEQTLNNCNTQKEHSEHGARSTSDGKMTARRQPLSILLPLNPPPISPSSGTGPPFGRLRGSSFATSSLASGTCVAPFKCSTIATATQLAAFSFHLPLPPSGAAKIRARKRDRLAQSCGRCGILNSSKDREKV